MLGFPIGLLAVNGFEWYAHKVWLHEYPAKHRNSPFFTHLRHHKRTRLNGFTDAGYAESMWQNSEMYTEKTALLFLGAAVTVVAPVAPFFTLGAYYGIYNYWRKHQKAHLDPTWAKTHLPWHYDHHMNSNQDANWCVTRPWFDYIMGTRIISDPAIAESNPLGMKLPRILEQPVNRLARRLLPRAFARIEGQSAQEKDQRQLGIEIPLANMT